VVTQPFYLSKLMGKFNQTIESDPPFPLRGSLEIEFIGPVQLLYRKNGTL
jgi:hypothetical protein